MINMRIYKLDISAELDDNIEVDFNSLVDTPAHLKKAFLFNEQKHLAFKEDERIVYGVMIAADLPIRRIDESGEYHVIFEAETVKKIREKYIKKGYNNRLNLNHDGKQVVKDVFMLDNFIIDEAKGINVPKLFEGQDLKDGSWIASYKIEDDELWADLKEGKYSGFSVEGIFNMIKSKPKTNKMSIQKLKEKVVSFFENIEEEEEKKEEKKYETTATLEDGTVVYYDGELSVGTAIMVEVDGVMTQAPEGTHILDSGIAISVDAEGNVAEIIEPTPDEAMSRDEVAEAMSMLADKMTEKFEKILAERDNKIKELEEKFMEFKGETPPPAKSKFKTVSEILNNK
jgi:DNA-binding transcriptional MerR regulator